MVVGLAVGRLQLPGCGSGEGCCNGSRREGELIEAHGEEGGTRLVDVAAAADQSVLQDLDTWG